MATTIQHAKRQRFATQLREAIDGRGVSVRAFSRELNPLAPETARSNLSRWLRGSHMPSRTSRRTLAAALGLSADHFESDDDEESDLVGVLVGVVRELVRADVREAVRVELERQIQTNQAPAARMAASTAGAHTNGG